MSNKDVLFWVTAVLSGFLLALSSAPYDYSFLAFIAFVPIFLITKNISVHKQGLAFALASTIIIANWWHSSIIFSSLFFILILIIISIAFYIWAVLSSKFRKDSSNPIATLFMPAIIWIGLERILSSEFVGIPCNIGITQVGNNTLIQSANIFGIYTTSFLIILSNTALAMLIGVLINKKYEKKHVIAISLVAVIFMVNFIYGNNQLNQTNKLIKPIKVVMIQPVISSSLYVNSWRNPESRDFVRKTLNELTHDALKVKPNILVWPEGGNGYLNMRITKLRNKLYNIASSNKTDLFISSNDIDENGKKYNTVFSISNKGRYLDRYDKVMLIPGAEDSYTAGTGFKPIKSSFGMVGASICYESNFPSPLRKLTSNGADLLFVSTSDAPFKKTSLTINHTRTAVFRAIENNRWVIHASNTGPSVIVSPKGVITASAGFYQRGYVSGNVEYINEKSIFTLYGYLVPIFFGLFVLLFISVSLFKYYIKNKSSGEITLARFIPKSISYKASLTFFVLIIVQVSLLISIILSSIVIVYRMAPDNEETTLADATTDFFEPLHKTVPDKVAKKFLQASSNTCGPAVLAYLFSYFGHEVLETELIPSMSLTQKGTSLLELKKTVIKNGFQAKGVKENYTALMTESLPVIAYINDSHYVVVNKITSYQIYLFDPLLGHVQITREIFESRWKGYILLVNMKKIKPSV